MSSHQNLIGIYRRGKNFQTFFRINAKCVNAIGGFFMKLNKGKKLGKQKIVRKFVHCPLNRCCLSSIRNVRLTMRILNSRAKRGNNYKFEAFGCVSLCLPVCLWYLLYLLSELVPRLFLYLKAHLISMLGCV